MRQSRTLIWVVAMLLISVLSLSACAGKKAPTPPAGQGGAGKTTDPAPREGHSEAGDLDTKHMNAMRAFPAKTEGTGGALAPFTVDNGVKVFNLTTKVVQWEVTPGVKKEAWTYNGMVPGPEIRVTEGDRIRINLKNELPESTTIHWHGLIIPQEMDGVSYVSQLPVKPGGTFTYEFTVGGPGTFMYHSHHDGTKQVMYGLLGSFVVEPKDKAAYPIHWDREQTLVLNDGYLGYGINGKGFPATQPIVARKGEWVLLRYMSEGALIHPMHLHGQEMWVVARDGYPLPQRYQVDTVSVAPGERWDVLVHAVNPGKFVLHCHIFPHAEGDMGMYGLTTEMWVSDSPTSDHIPDAMEGKMGIPPTQPGTIPPAGSINKPAGQPGTSVPNPNPSPSTPATH